MSIKDFPLFKFNTTASSPEELPTTEALKKAIENLINTSRKISWNTEDKLDSMLYSFKSSPIVVDLDKAFIIPTESAQKISDDEWEEIMKKIGGKA